MPTLNIDLRAGFDGDAVELLVNNKSFSRSNVTTDYSIGLADKVETKVPVGQVSVEISLPGRKLSKSIKLDVNSDQHLGVSRTDSGIECEVSPEPFPYY